MSKIDKIVLNDTSYDLGGSSDDLLEPVETQSANLIDPSNIKNLGYYYSTDDGVTQTTATNYKVSEVLTPIDTDTNGAYMYIRTNATCFGVLNILCYHDDTYLGLANFNNNGSARTGMSLASLLSMYVTLRATTNGIRIQYTNGTVDFCLSWEDLGEFVPYGESSATSEVIKEEYIAIERFEPNYFDEVSNSNNLIDPKNLTAWGWHYASYTGAVVDEPTGLYQTTKEKIPVGTAIEVFVRVRNPLSSSQSLATILCWNGETYLGTAGNHNLNNADETTHLLQDGTTHIAVDINAFPSTFDSSNLCLSLVSLDAFEEFSYGKKLKEKFLPESLSAGFSTLSTLYGKKIVFFGDSIAAGGYITRRVGANVGAYTYNAAVGGTSMALRGAESTVFTKWWTMVNIADCIATGDWTDTLDFLSQGEAGSRDAQAYEYALHLSQLDWSTDVDVCVIMFGANDTATDSDDPTATTTYGGAARHVIEALQTAYPNVRLVFCTVIWRSTEDDTKCTILENACSDYCIQCINNRKTLGINSLTASTYMGDSVHPNTKGADLMIAHMTKELW